MLYFYFTFPKGHANLKSRHITGVNKKNERSLIKMKKVTVEIELYDDDMTSEDVEKAILETGLASVDCTYNIKEEEY